MGLRPNIFLVAGFVAYVGSLIIPWISTFSLIALLPIWPVSEGFLELIRGFASYTFFGSWVSQIYLVLFFGAVLVAPFYERKGRILSGLIMLPLLYGFYSLAGVVIASSQNFVALGLGFYLGAFASAMFVLVGVIEVVNGFRHRRKNPDPFDDFDKYPENETLADLR